MSKFLALLLWVVFVAFSMQGCMQTSHTVSPSSQEGSTNEMSSGASSEGQESTSEGIVSVSSGIVISANGGLCVDADGGADSEVLVPVGNAVIEKKDGTQAAVTDIKPGMRVSYTTVNGTLLLTDPPTLQGCVKVIIESEAAESQSISKNNVSGEIVSVHNDALKLTVDSAEWASEYIYISGYSEMIYNSDGEKITMLDLRKGMKVNVSLENAVMDNYETPFIHGAKRVDVTGE